MTHGAADWLVYGLMAFVYLPYIIGGILGAIFGVLLYRRFRDGDDGNDGHC